MKAKIYTCPYCYKVKKCGEWNILTALDVLRLKAQAGEWEIEVAVCPDCQQKLGIGNGGKDGQARSPT